MTGRAGFCPCGAVLWFFSERKRGTCQKCATAARPLCVEWPHYWIDISVAGGPPTAMCSRCNEQRPIVCKPDADDHEMAR